MAVTAPIYLDYNATTPCDREVVASMLPYFNTVFGNASSKTHPYGWQAKKAIDIARAHHATLLNCNEDEIIFTSGATESINTAIKGLYEVFKNYKSHVIACSTEHKAVLDTCEYLERRGADVSYLEVNSNGDIDLELLRETITIQTLLVCVMYSNNETGVIHPIEEIATICKENNVFLLVDATQAIGKVDIKPHQLGIDLMAYSSHKMYGPKGVGALYISKSNKKLKFDPLIHGGGHEQGYRSGTLNVPGIVGFGEAARLAKKTMLEVGTHTANLINHFENKITLLEQVTIVGGKAQRLGNVSNVWIRFCESEQVIGALSDKIAIASGSACASAEATPSHVMIAMGLHKDQAQCCIRLSVGKYSTLKEIKTALRLLTEAVITIRAKSPKWQLFQQGIDMTGY